MIELLLLAALWPQVSLTTFGLFMGLSVQSVGPGPPASGSGRRSPSTVAPVSVGSGGTGSGGSGMRHGTPVPQRMPERGLEGLPKRPSERLQKRVPARVKLASQTTGVASEDASGRSR